jgi:hypothetical protein
MAVDNNSLNAEEILRNFGDPELLNLENIIEPLVDADSDSNNLQTVVNSPYFDCNKLPDSLMSTNNNFSVLSLNSQSIRAKLDELKLLLSTAKSQGIKFNAICIQESWLGDSPDTSAIQTDGYICHSFSSNCSSHGGLVTYVDEDFHVSPLYYGSNLWEGLFLDISGGNLLKKIRLGNVYRPPRNNNNGDTIHQFLSEIEPVIIDANEGNREVIITGDFNINLLKINFHYNSGAFLESMLSLGLLPKITLPTRIGTRSATLIDNIFCKLTENAASAHSGIICSKI